MKRNDGWFSKFAKKVALASGRSWVFGTAFGIIIVWILTGPAFHYSDTWQLVINTGTSVITFLMVFLIQNTQNRDSQAIQLKLDELIRATKGAHTAVMDSEELTDTELSKIKLAYTHLAEHGRKALREGVEDTDTPDIIFDFFENRPDTKN